MPWASQRVLDKVCDVQIGMKVIKGDECMCVIFCMRRRGVKTGFCFLFHTVLENTSQAVIHELEDNGTMLAPQPAATCVSGMTSLDKILLDA